MQNNQELNYRLYVNREDDISRDSYESEKERYDYISAGDVENIKANIDRIKRNFLQGKGKLSDNPLNNVKYHFIISAAVIARNCIDKGLSHDTAYTMSDIYIQRADKCNSIKMIVNMLGDMQIDFATKMREHKKKNVISLHIRKCIDYIYDNLHNKLTIESASKHLNIHYSYLSKLFYKETGVHFKDFVTNARISVAENMLLYSDFSISEISLSLGFSSQSSFTNVFKKAKGDTPHKYRNKFRV